MLRGLHNLPIVSIARIHTCMYTYIVYDSKFNIYKFIKAIETDTRRTCIDNNIIY